MREVFFIINILKLLLLKVNLKKYQILIFDQFHIAIIINA